MNTILVLIETPARIAGNDSAMRDWQELWPKLETNANTASGAKMLARNLWQIDVRKNLPFLVELLHEVGKIHLLYSILPLEEDQEWISSTAANI